MTMCQINHSGQYPVLKRYSQKPPQVWQERGSVNDERNHGPVHTQLTMIAAAAPYACYGRAQNDLTWDAENDHALVSLP